MDVIFRFSIIIDIYNVFVDIIDLFYIQTCLIFVSRKRKI